MPDCDILQLLSINCHTTNDQQKGRKIKKQDKNWKNNPHPYNKSRQEIDYFIAGPDIEVNRVESVETTQKMRNEYSNRFTGIGWFKCTFSLQVKDSAKPYQVPNKCVVYALQEPFKIAGKATRTQIFTPLKVDETVEWCNNFVIVPKPNVTICLCTDSVWLNQALIRQVHSGPTINGILYKLTNACYVTLIDTSSGHRNLKLDKRSSYSTTFACQFSRSRFTRLAFGVAPTGDLFQWKIDETFNDLPNVFGIADDLIVGYFINCRDCDKTLEWVIQICQQ